MKSHCQAEWTHYSSPKKLDAPFASAVQYPVRATLGSLFQIIVLWNLKHIFPPTPLQHTRTLKTSDEKNDMSLQSLKGAHYRLAPPCPKNQI